VLRFRMPDGDTSSTTWSAARSPSPGHVPDFVLVRGNGDPLYTLVNPSTTR
jgi:glutamyl-tRNA synthetase